MLAEVLRGGDSPSRVYIQGIAGLYDVKLTNLFHNIRQLRLWSTYPREPDAISQIR
jgi:hypothetical protein